MQQFTFDRYDTYDWYLKLGSLANVNAKYLQGKIPTWNDFVAHPDYDAFWKRQTMMPYIRSVNVPTLNVAGWWDQEDFYGPLPIYEALEKHDTARLNYLVVGPWNHGGWTRGAGDELGDDSVRQRDTGKYFREEVQAPWFAYWLKDKGKLDLPGGADLRGGQRISGGAGTTWPPKSRHASAASSTSTPDEEAVLRRGAARPERRVRRFDKLRVGSGASRCRTGSGRSRPTYFPGGSRWSTWLVEDQRFVDDRADVLSWETAPLEADVSIAGEVIAKLFASTTGSDADWIVKLIDVYPEEYPEDWELAG